MHSFLSGMKARMRGLRYGFLLVPGALVAGFVALAFVGTPEEGHDALDWRASDSRARAPIGSRSGIISGRRRTSASCASAQRMARRIWRAVRAAKEE